MRIHSFLIVAGRLQVGCSSPNCKVPVKHVLTALNPPNRLHLVRKHHKHYYLSIYGCRVSQNCFILILFFEANVRIFQQEEVQRSINFHDFAWILRRLRTVIEGHTWLRDAPELSEI